ncbi:hypothetical protein PAXINDRAFT_14756, partial [Paxillus involutus ATCC 200175]
MDASRRYLRTSAAPELQSDVMEMVRSYRGSVPKPPQSRTKGTEAHTSTPHTVDITHTHELPYQLLHDGPSTLSLSPPTDHQHHRQWAVTIDGPSTPSTNSTVNGPSSPPLPAPPSMGHHHRRTFSTVTNSTVDGPSPSTDLHHHRRQWAIITTVANSTVDGLSAPMGNRYCHHRRAIAITVVAIVPRPPHYPTSLLCWAHPSLIGHHQLAAPLPTSPLLLGQPITYAPSSIGHPIVYETSFTGLP